jgi:hypothetical protein
MNHAGWKTALSLLALCASLSAAGESVWFWHGDWNVVCDNTRTCRMAACFLADDDNDRDCGSVLITRAAGPDTPLEGAVMPGGDNAEKKRIFNPPAILTLRIDGKSRGKLRLLEKYPPIYPLTSTQIEALLAAARRDRVVVFEGKSADFEETFEGKPIKRKGKFVSFTLSGNGVSAAMLKMDEVQGRIGTPRALIRKGNKPETSVPPPQGFSFSHEDWEIACDNTRACRMAGYCSEEDSVAGRGCASVLITRAAGPDTPLEGKVALANYGGNEGYKLRVLTLWIDGKSKGELNLRKKEFEYPLTPTQIRALLAAARNDKEVRFESASKSFTLSGKGGSAVMLKMDEFQGRIGMPGALIRKGEKPEGNVFPPLPAPVIRAAKVSDAPSRALTWPEVAAIWPLLRQSLGKDKDCHFKMQEPLDAEFTLTPLNERHVLISVLCWRGAYNRGNAYWVMDRSFKETPEFVTDQADLYKDGVISGLNTGRGLGDCWSRSSWVWDGRAFRQSGKWHTGMCRGVYWSSTWRLPTLVTRVIDENGKEISPDDSGSKRSLDKRSERPGFNIRRFAPLFSRPLDCGLRPCPSYYESKLRWL